ncbi:ATP-binding protein [Psychrobacter sp. 16-MNA-CIBAN-0192]|uniref:sensor histidine kinase n=1 Tax=Psychrobacter sp. 16-MNA-CIBAN-0192 TaxID=3140448 RepID=UPI0033345774
MRNPASFITMITDYLQQGDVLPAPQLRRLGLLYSSYRLVISIFFVVMSYITTHDDGSLLLPSLLSQTALSIYVLVSFGLFNLFYVINKLPSEQLALGLTLDIIMLSLLLYTNGAPDLQLTLLYMVVVAASFMLLQASQAIIITLLAVIFVIYQQFFYAITNSMSLADLVDALLISFSFLAVGFLSWSISQRLIHVEKMAIQQAQEVNRLSHINQEVISQMHSGVMVIDKGDIVLANTATYQLLGLKNMGTDTSAASEISPLTAKNRRYRDWLRPTFYRKKSRPIQTNKAMISVQQQIQALHLPLLESCSSVAAGLSRNFIYDLPVEITTALIHKLRVQIIPLKDNSQLVLLEDLQREQASAQQLKLASLGQLTASIAHEIRNPLAAISQASQLLMEDSMLEVANTSVAMSLDHHDMAGNHELYKIIFAQTKRVNRIIEDVLKLSRQQSPNQQPIAIVSWMRQFLVNYFSDEVTLQAYSHPIIEFDTHQLEQILINIINNGLRYGQRVDPEAGVEVEIYNKQNNVIIDILDHGRGVDAAHLKQLFNPFFTTDKAGTGLGLYLSQAFSEANHAHLRYAPEHKKSCFRLIIPALSLASDNIGD